MRRFLISRETLSIRMLDDNLDPTPLLKEIRDDKVATIIIDANASVSYLILKKVGPQASIHASDLPTHTQLLLYTVHTLTLGRICRFLLCVRLGNSGWVHEGRAQLTICKIIKRHLPKFHRLHICCCNRINYYFLPAPLCGAARGRIFMRVCPQQSLTLLRKVFDKRPSFAGVQMLGGLVVIHATLCNADSQRGDSQVECVWDVFTGPVGAAVCP